MHADQYLSAENNTFIIQVISTCEFNYSTFLWLFIICNHLEITQNLIL